MSRIYVRVECLHLEDGVSMPQKVIWTDGREWQITRVIYTCSAADVEFEGIGYTVLIGGAEKYIYQLGSRWYVESG